MLGELPESLRIPTVDGQADAETDERPLPLALQHGPEVIHRSAERPERHIEAEHAIRQLKRVDFGGRSAPLAPCRTAAWSGGGRRRTTASGRPNQARAASSSTRRAVR
jgi:hypothetical protein